MATTKPDARHVVQALLDRHGRTFADEVGIGAVRNTPSVLFRVLCMALLMSARIRASVAVDATRALGDAGWTTARKLAASTWAERAKVLNRAGYARYDERTSTMLGDTAALLLDRYGGDLRRLRDEAARDPDAERRLIDEFKGIGTVGVDIFFREVQAAWPELRPFADRRALRAAKALGLGGDVDALARLVPARRFPVLVAALVRADLDGDHADVLAAARHAA